MFLAAICAVVSGAGPLYAAPDAADEAFRFFQAEAEVFGAAKHAQTVSRAPASVQIITADEIATYGYRNLAEALQSLPGIYATNDRNYAYLWIRGFGRPGDYTDRVLILLNGHRLNDNIYGQVMPGFEFSVDMSAVERIEVVKGPGSALYGDNAFFAVVNVITRSAPVEPGALVGTEAGSYGTVKGFGDAGRRFAGGGELYASGSYRHMRGQDLAYPEFPDANGGTAVAADREENYTLYTSASRWGWKLQGSAAKRTKRVPTASYGTSFNHNGTYTSDERRFLELALPEYALGDHLVLSGRGYYDWYDYHANYVYPASLVNHDIARGSWYGEELRLRSSFLGERNTSTIGQEFEKGLLARQTNYDEEPHNIVMDDDHPEYHWAMFAQQELGLHRSVDLTLGLRYDRYQSFGHTWNPGPR
jgi:iron complex outermembrane receptor protein